VEVTKVFEGEGYEVIAHCEEDAEQGASSGVVDFYEWDSSLPGFLPNFTRLTPEQMRQAEGAGWPSVRAYLGELLGSTRSSE
jgi:hypothetical protein